MASDTQQMEPSSHLSRCVGYEERLKGEKTVAEDSREGRNSFIGALVWRDHTASAGILKVLMITAEC